jgi:hypothetical protein
LLQSKADLVATYFRRCSVASTVHSLTAEGSHHEGSGHKSITVGVPGLRLANGPRTGLASSRRCPKKSVAGSPGGTAPHRDDADEMLRRSTLSSETLTSLSVLLRTIPSVLPAVPKCIECARSFQTNTVSEFHLLSLRMNHRVAHAQRLAKAGRAAAWKHLMDKTCG